MTDFRAVLAEMKRPRMLIRAARFGLDDYRRERDLRRLINAEAVPALERSLPRLLSEESRLEEIRQSGDASYSISRHIDLLIALMGEVRLLPKNVAV